jgi:hypothetical protein
MIKLHIALWEFLVVGVALSLVGVFAVRARELKDRLRRRRRETQHGASLDGTPEGCAA